MPSLALAMEETTVIFASEKKNAKIVPNILKVDNFNGARPAVIALVDRFTPSITNEESDPEVTPVERLHTTVDNGSIEIIGDELKNVKILGQAEVTIEEEDSSCIVTLGYDFE